MSKKMQRDKDEKRLLEMMDEVQKISWNMDLVDEALAMAWKYFHKCERQTMMLQQLQKRVSNKTEAERNNRIDNEIETVGQVCGERRVTMSEDLIRRSDAIGAITNYCENECYYRGDNWCPQCQRKEFEEAINVIPSADRPQGEWIKEGCAKGSEMCNQCGFVQFEGRVDNYCSNCGARMKGADDE